MKDGAKKALRRSGVSSKTHLRDLGWGCKVMLYSDANKRKVYKMTLSRSHKIS